MRGHAGSRFCGWFLTGCTGDAALDQGVAEPVGIVAPVAEQDVGPGECADHQGGAFVIAHLTFAQQQDQRPALAIAHGLELRVQAAFGPPDTSGNIPFFKRLAAVR